MPGRGEPAPHPHPHRHRDRDRGRAPRARPPRAPLTAPGSPLPRPGAAFRVGRRQRRPRMCERRAHAPLRSTPPREAAAAAAAGWLLSAASGGARPPRAEGPGLPKRQAACRRGSPPATAPTFGAAGSAVTVSFGGPGTARPPSSCRRGSRSRGHFPRGAQERLARRPRDSGEKACALQRLASRLALGKGGRLIHPPRPSAAQTDFGVPAGAPSGTSADCQAALPPADPSPVAGAGLQSDPPAPGSVSAGPIPDSPPLTFSEGPWS